MMTATFDTKTALFVDVRTEAEYQGGHKDGALNIPLHELPYRLSEIKGLGKEPVVFYCRSGNRSGQAVSYLQQQGFGNIYNGGSLEEALAL